MSFSFSALLLVNKDVHIYGFAFMNKLGNLSINQLIINTVHMVHAAHKLTLKKDKII